jgi:ribosomal protein L7/L12
MKKNYHKEAMTIFLTRTFDFARICKWVAINHPSVFIKAALAEGVTLKTKEDAIKETARALVANRRNIDAIKFVRNETGLGLKEAKDYVDAL